MCAIRSDDADDGQGLSKHGNHCLFVCLERAAGVETESGWWLWPPELVIPAKTDRLLSPSGLGSQAKALRLTSQELMCER